MADTLLAGLDILIVEDEPMLRKRLAAQLTRFGADVSTADTLQAARNLCAGLDLDFILLDVNLPDGRGTDLLKDRSCQPDVGVIVMTAHGGVAGAIEAMRLGALDYLVKPFDAEELPLVLQRARRSRQSARHARHRREDTTEQALYFGTALAAIESQLNKILSADQRIQDRLPPVLIQGETGTGKTTIARWLHQKGPRGSQELVEVNCSALPEALAESELFGHVRGAFTDARTERMGLFEAANGGTLFLDELPSLPLPLQAKVLSAIEDGRIRRVGGNKPIPVDVRIIAATNRSLQELAAQGQFREDLFHRLDLYRIVIPPLRERGEDILKLAELILERLCRKYRCGPKTISPAGRQRLVSHAWPGNVRELAHELERAVAFEDTAELHFTHLAGESVPGAQSVPATGDWLNPAFTFPESGFSLEAATERFIQLALEQSQGNVSAAGRLLGMPRDFVRYRLGLKSRKPTGEDGH